MKQFKMMAGFGLAFVALVIVFVLSNALYHLQANTTAIAIAIGVSAVLLVAGLFLLERAGARKSSKVVQIVFALALVIVALDVSSTGVRTHRYSQRPDDTHEEYPMTADELLPNVVGVGAFLGGAGILFIAAFLRRPINPLVTRIIKASLGLIIALLAFAAAREGYLAWEEKPAEIGFESMKAIRFFVIGASVIGLGLLISAALPQWTISSVNREKQ